MSGLTIDLNGHTITTVNGGFVLEGVGFTVCNGIIDAQGGSYALGIGNGKETNDVIVKDLTLEGGVNIFCAENVKLYGLTFTGTNYYSVWCNCFAEAIIEDGVYSTGDGKSVLGGCVYTDEETGEKYYSSIQVNGGTFKVGKNQDLSLSKSDLNHPVQPVISGGFFYKDGGDDDLALYNELTGYLEDSTYCVAKATSTINGEEQSGYKVMLISEAEAKIGDVYYATFEDAINAVQTGETIEVLNDVTVSNTIEIADGRSFTIDLNLNTLTFSPSGNQNGSLFDIGESDGTSTASAVKITDGGIVANAPIYGTYAIIYVYDGATLELDAVSITTTGSALFPVGEATKVSVVDCIIDAGVYCVATNAGDTENGGVVIEISGSQLTSNGYQKTASGWDSDDCPVLINVPCTLTIKDSTLTGNRQGLVVRAGTATVEDTVINYIPTFGSDTSYESKAWGSGNEVPMGAIVVGNHSTGKGYDNDRSLTMKSVTVNIIDDTIESKDVNLIYADLNNDRSNTDTCTIEIEGGFAYNTYADAQMTSVNTNINALAKIKDNVDFDKEFSVTDFAELRAAAAIGGEIVLADDIEITMYIEILDGTILDTGDYTITIEEGITLSLASGSVVTGMIAGPDSNVMTVSGMKAGDGGITITGGSLIIEGVIVQDSGTYSGVTVTVSGDSITIAGTLEDGATMVIEEDTSVTIAEESEFTSNGTITNNGAMTNEGTFTNTSTVTNNGTIANSGSIVNSGDLTNTGTLKVTDEATVTGNGIVNTGIIADMRTSGTAVPIDTDSTGTVVVTEENASAYEESGTKVIVETDEVTSGTVTSNTNEYAFVDAVTTTDDLNIVMNDGYKQYTIVIPAGVTIAAATVISVEYLDFTSDTTKYEITTPGITQFSVKVPVQTGFKSAKVYCDGSTDGISNVKYNASSGYVTFDAGHNSTFTIVLSSATPSSGTSSDAIDEDTAFVAAIIVLVVAILALAVVIKRK